jgi:hypothetical protein
LQVQCYGRAAKLVRGKEVRAELLVYLHHLLAGEAAAGDEQARPTTSISTRKK